MSECNNECGCHEHKELPDLPPLESLADLQEEVDVYKIDFGRAKSFKDLVKIFEHMEFTVAASPNDAIYSKLRKFLVPTGETVVRNNSTLTGEE